MTNILLVGGTGTLGIELLKVLVPNKDNFVTVFSRDPHKQAAVSAEYGHTVRLILGDVRDRERVMDACVGQNIVIHAAALKRIERGETDAAEYLGINIDGTVNVARAADRARVDRAIFVSSDKACVDYYTPIRTKDGKTIPIHEIVDKKLDVEVETMGKNGVEYRRVVGWYKNERNNRSLFRLSYQYGPQNSKAHTGSGSVVLTGDHKVLTEKGWLPASEIKNGDLISTNEVRPNHQQMAFIIGCVLGDSYLSNGYRSTVEFSHCESQFEWLTIKKNILENFYQSDFYEYIKAPTAKGKVLRQYSFSLKGSAWARELRDIFYVDGKKIIPRQLLEKYFSPELLAAWYLDDGCLTGLNTRLATHGFTHDDVNWLVEFFSERGLECYLYDCKYKNKVYPELRFTARGSNALFSMIASLVPTSMRYKLPEQSIEYDVTKWDLGKPVPYYGKAIVSELIDTFESPGEKITLPWNNKGIQICKRGHSLSGDNVRIIPQTGSRQCITCQKMMSKRKGGTNHSAFTRSVYCINVEETHNFITHGVVLHNCSPLNLYGISKAAGEHIWRNAQTTSKHTVFNAVRYGNVMGSNGSVWQMWQRQRAQTGKISVRAPEPTRFVMTKKDAVDIIDHAIHSTMRGVIFVPHDLPAFSLFDLARVFEPDEEKWDLRNMLVGEKQHEVLLAPGEPIVKYNEKYTLLGASGETTYGPVDPVFSSARTPYRLTGEQVLKILKEN